MVIDSTKEFPPLQTKSFTPFNEVINSQNKQHPLNKQRIKPNTKDSNTNQFYNFQKDNCNDFIGNRESTQSANRLALNKEKSYLKYTQEDENNLNQMDIPTVVQESKKLHQLSQRPVLKDVSNYSKYLKEKKEELQLIVDHEINLSKPIRTHPKLSKESSKLQSNVIKKTLSQ